MFKHDNNDAINEMCSLYLIPVKRYVLKLCHNETLANDITSIAFYKAINNIDSFKEGKMLTWLCEIAKNTYYDELKKKEFQNVLKDDFNDEIDTSLNITLDDKCISYEEKINLYKNIMKLDDDMRDIVYLRIFADLSFKEIGEILGKSENLVRVMFYRSKTKLKGWIDNNEK